jgi:hypothetical protein
MKLPIADIVMLSVLGVSIFAGLVMWWVMSHKMRSMQFELQPMTALMKYAPKPANEVIEVIDEIPARDSSIRIRVGSRLRAVE